MIVFLGAGNMARALGLALKREKRGDSFGFYSPSGISAKALADETSSKWIENLNHIQAQDIVVLACKPQQFPHLIKDLKQSTCRPLKVISLMAGIGSESILKDFKKSLGYGPEIVRFMSTLQVSVGQAPGVFFPHDLPDWCNPFLALGPAIKLSKEEDFHAATLMVGSFPGYMAKVLLWNIRWGISQGLNAKEMVQSQALGLKTLGESLLNLECSPEAIDNFCKRVCSPQGITEAVLKSLEKQDMEKLWDQSLDAGCKRSQELAGGEKI